MCEFVVCKAGKEQAAQIVEIVKYTILQVYTKYYSNEVVQFCLDYHDLETIKKEIAEGRVYVVCQEDQIVGTGTIEGNMITRVYVLPEKQGKGAGSVLMDHLEKLVIQDHGCVLVEASLPAGEFYRKRHYVQKEHQDYPVANGKIFSYEIMCKR